MFFLIRSTNFLKYFKINPATKDVVYFTTYKFRSEDYLHLKKVVVRVTDVLSNFRGYLNLLSFNWLQFKGFQWFPWFWTTWKVSFFYLFKLLNSKVKKSYVIVKKKKDLFFNFFNFFNFFFSIIFSAFRKFASLFFFINYIKKVKVLTQLSVRFNSTIREKKRITYPFLILFPGFLLTKKINWNSFLTVYSWTFTVWHFSPSYYFNKKNQWRYFFNKYFLYKKKKYIIFSKFNWPHQSWQITHILNKKINFFIGIFNSSKHFFYYYNNLVYTPLGYLAPIFTSIFQFLFLIKLLLNYQFFFLKNWLFSIFTYIFMENISILLPINKIVKKKFIETYFSFFFLILLQLNFKYFFFDFKLQCSLLFTQLSTLVITYKSLITRKWFAFREYNSLHFKRINKAKWFQVFQDVKSLNLDKTNSLLKSFTLTKFSTYYFTFKIFYFFFLDHSSLKKSKRNTYPISKLKHSLAAKTRYSNKDAATDFYYTFKYRLKPFFFKQMSLNTKYKKLFYYAWLLKRIKWKQLRRLIKKYQRYYRRRNNAGHYRYKRWYQRTFTKKIRRLIRKKKLRVSRGFKFFKKRALKGKRVYSFLKNKNKIVRRIATRGQVSSKFEILQEFKQKKHKFYFFINCITFFKLIKKFGRGYKLLRFKLYVFFRWKLKFKKSRLFFHRWKKFLPKHKILLWSDFAEGFKLYKRPRMLQLLNVYISNDQFYHKRSYITFYTYKKLFWSRTIFMRYRLYLSIIINNLLGYNFFWHSLNYVIFKARNSHQIIYRKKGRQRYKGPTLHLNRMYPGYREVNFRIRTLTFDTRLLYLKGFSTAFPWTKKLNSTIFKFGHRTN